MSLPLSHEPSFPLHPVPTLVSRIFLLLQFSEAHLDPGRRTMAKRKRVEGDDTKLSDAFNSITADMSLHSTADKEGVKTIFRCHQAKLAASPILLAQVQAITSSNADVKPILYLEEDAETLSSILRLLYDGLRAMSNPAFTPIDLIVSIHIACEKYGIDSFNEPLNQTVLFV